MKGKVFHQCTFECGSRRALLSPRRLQQSHRVIEQSLRFVNVLQLRFLTPVQISEQCVELDRRAVELVQCTNVVTRMNRASLP